MWKHLTDHLQFIQPFGFIQSNRFLRIQKLLKSYYLRVSLLIKDTFIYQGGGTNV